MKNLKQTDVAPGVECNNDGQDAGPHPIETPAYPPRVLFGPTFTVCKTVGLATFPRPDAVEMNRSAELAYGLRDLTARLLNLETEKLEVEFGMANCGSAPSKRFCYQVMVPGWTDIDPMMIGNVQRSIAPFLHSISSTASKNQSDFDLPMLDDEARLIVETVASDFRMIHGESRYPAGIKVSGGEKELTAPARIASRPPREEKTIPLSTVGLVDVLGRSSRELKIKLPDNKVVKAKFDVDEHLKQLCQQLLDQSMCKTELESHVDQGGKETVTLISTQELQPRLPGT